MLNHTNHFVQQQTIEEILKNINDVQNLNIGNFPIEVQQMLQYIHYHLFEPTLTVEAVKRACHLTNNNITTKFRYHVGLGTREYIRKQRLKAAASILQERGKYISSCRCCRVHGRSILKTLQKSIWRISFKLSPNYFKRYGQEK